MKSRASSRAPISRRRTRRMDVAELDFNDDRIPPRAGDPVSWDDMDSLSRRRGQQGGLTGAAVPDALTADDLSPETLLDEDGGDSILRRRVRPEDTVLHPIEEEELFAADLDNPPSGFEEPDEDGVDRDPKR